MIWLAGEYDTPRCRHDRRILGVAKQYGTPPFMASKRQEMTNVQTTKSGGQTIPINTGRTLGVALAHQTAVYAYPPANHRVLDKGPKGYRHSSTPAPPTWAGAGQPPKSFSFYGVGKHASNLKLGGKPPSNGGAQISRGVSCVDELRNKRKAILSSEG